MNGYGKVQYSGVTDADIRGRQMEELIRKKDALDALMAERKHLLAKGQKGAEHILTHHGYNVIVELPPVQPKHGKWIEIKNKKGVVIAIKCDKCSQFPKHGVRSDFCPNCGADMREVRKDGTD